MTTTRFAPSPTGDLHLGGALVAVASHTLARGSGGALRLRIEDLDPPRIVAGSAARIARDLDWLGVGVDGAIVRQSERRAHYEAAVAALERAGRVYPCDCSRADIARVTSAPHEGEETVYPGICRALNPSRQMKRAPALRLRTEGFIAFDDLACGSQRHELGALGDFVLRRGDGAFAYQLAAAVDDAEMNIDVVVRGRDLLSSTPRQLHLMHLLRYNKTPRYAHVPLVVDALGQRLSKRARGASVRALREAGVSADEVMAWLRGVLGMTQPGDAIAWPTSEAPVPAAWARLARSELT